MEETEEVVGEAFVADDQAAEVARVSKKAFGLPAPPVTPKLATVLRHGLCLVVVMPVPGKLEFAAMVGTMALAQAENYRVLRCGANEAPWPGEIQKIVNGATKILQAQAAFVPNMPEGYTLFLRDEPPFGQHRTG